MTRVVVAEWEDTTNIAAWSTPDEVRGFATDGAWLCQNIGWLVHEDDNCVVIAGRRTTDGEQLGLFERIPKRALLRLIDIDAGDGLVREGSPEVSGDG